MQHARAQQNYVNGVYIYIYTTATIYYVNEFKICNQNVVADMSILILWQTQFHYFIMGCFIKGKIHVQLYF